MNGTLIFNGGFMGTLEDKMKYFSGTMQWLRIQGRLVQSYMWQRIRKQSNKLEF